MWFVPVLNIVTYLLEGAAFLAALIAVLRSGTRGGKPRALTALGAAVVLVIAATVINVAAYTHAQAYALLYERGNEVRIELAATGVQLRNLAEAGRPLPQGPSLIDDLAAAGYTPATVVPGLRLVKISATSFCVQGLLPTGGPGHWNSEFGPSGETVKSGYCTGQLPGIY